jgi:hypothetical protein
VNATPINGLGKLEVGEQRITCWFKMTMRYATEIFYQKKRPHSMGRKNSSVKLPLK